MALGSTAVVTWQDAIDRVAAHEIDTQWSTKRIGWLSLGWWRARSILVTGEPGVGKSALLDYLTGSDFGGDPSADVESAFTQVIETGASFGLATVPGQGLSERDNALNKAFSSESFMDGIIHCVASGMRTEWPTDGDDILPPRVAATTKEYFDTALATEARELGQMLETVFKHVQRRNGEGGPRWILFLVTKADLWWPRRAEVGGRYTFNDPESASSFRDHVETFKSRCGDMISIPTYTLPFSSETESLSLDTTVGRWTYPSMLDLSERERLNSATLERLGSL